MTLYNITTNVTSFDQLYAGVSSTAPWLFPLILFFEFCVILIVGVYAQSRRVGFSNIPMWGTIAGMVTTTSAFMLSIVSGIITIDTIGVCFAVTVLFAIWFFAFTDND